jgi:alpha-glucosidase
MVWESNAPNGGFSDHKPWLPVSPEHVKMAVNREAGDPASTLAVYTRLLAFRRAHPALRKGTIRFLDAPADVLAFLREGEGERLLCVFNISGNAARFALAPGMKVAPLAGHGFSGRLDGDSIGLAGGDVFYGAVA